METTNSQPITHKTRLPNGMGSVTKNGGNRHKPFLARVYDKELKKQKFIGYFETRKEALLHLVEVIENPSLLTTITLEECYKRMMTDHKSDITEGSLRNYESAWKKVSSLYKIPLINIKYTHLQNCIKTASKTVGYATQRKIRSLFHLIFKYAVRYELVSKDVSLSLEIDKEKVQNPKVPFNTRQINKVWKIANDIEDPDTDIARKVIILCYTGLRSQEFLNVKKSDLKIGKCYFQVTESKTEAGKGRMIPIHDRIKGFVKYFKDKKHKYIFSTDAKEKESYSKFKKSFDSLMTRLKLKHNPHECRHTLATWLDEVDANATSVKKILGHSIDDITKGTYTHKSLAELKKAMKKVK